MAANDQQLSKSSQTVAPRSNLPFDQAVEGMQSSLLAGGQTTGPITATKKADAIWTWQPNCFANLSAKNPATQSLAQLPPYQPRPCESTEAKLAENLGPKRSVLPGRFKSPNRWRWLAHSRKAPAHLIHAIGVWPPKASSRSAWLSTPDCAPCANALAGRPVPPSARDS